MMIRYSSIKLKRMLLIFMLALPHLKPDSVVVMWPAVEKLFDLGRLLSLFIILLLNIRGKRKMNLLLAVILLLSVWLSFSTMVNGSKTLRTNIVSLGSAVALPLLIYYFSDQMEDLIDALLMNYEWLIYASLISVVLFLPTGLYIKEGAINRKEFFLGNENQIIFYALPAICLVLLHAKRTRRKLRAGCLIIACAANEVLVWCATGIVGLVAFGLVFFLAERWRSVRYYSVLGVSLVADLLITVVRFFDRQTFAARIITDVLGKDVTFSTRTTVWDLTYPLIQDNLLIGLGQGNHILSEKGDYFHTHNQYFELLLEGGIPMLVLFAVLILLVGRAMSYTRRITYGKKVMLAAAACLFVQFITTQRITAEVYIPFFLMAYVKEIDRITTGNGTSEWREPAGTLLPETE